MSTSITEYHIHIDGRTMTPAQLFELARGLVEAEAVSQEACPTPDTWEIEEPMRFQSFAHMPLNDMGQAECITVLAYHLWQLQERLTGGDGSHKSCDPIRIGYAPHSQYTAYSYVWSELDGQMYIDIADLEAALIRVFTERMTNLLANGRKREGVKW